MVTMVITNTYRHNNIDIIDNRMQMNIKMTLNNYTHDANTCNDMNNLIKTKGQGKYKNDTTATTTITAATIHYRI